MRQINNFPITRRIRMDWYQFADGTIYLFTPDDGLYANATKFHTAARVWAKRHGYAFHGQIIPTEGAQPSVAIQFTRENE